MKAKIVVTPKKAVLDPQGKTVQNALAHMGYTGVGAVHVGKYLEIELTGADKEAARKQIDEACHKILSNPVIEDYRFEMIGRRVALVWYKNELRCAPVSRVQLRPGRGPRAAQRARPFGRAALAQGSRRWARRMP